MDQDKNNNNSGLGFVSGLIIGGLIGAVVALVLAPQSGEETRDLIRGKAHEFRGKAMDLASDLRDRATDLASDLRSQADELGRRGRETFDNVRSQLNDAIETGKKAARAKRQEFETE
jgi:gas vesicle protein